MTCLEAISRSSPSADVRRNWETCTEQTQFVPDGARVRLLLLGRPRRLVLVALGVQQQSGARGSCWCWLCLLFVMDGVVSRGRPAVGALAGYR